MKVEILPSVVDDSKISFIKCRRHFRCDTVCPELWLAIPAYLAVLCLETDWNIRIGKQGYVFISTDLKK